MTVSVFTLWCLVARTKRDRAVCSNSLVHEAYSILMPWRSILPTLVMPSLSKAMFLVMEARENLPSPNAAIEPPQPQCRNRNIQNSEWKRIPLTALRWKGDQIQSIPKTCLFCFSPFSCSFFPVYKVLSPPLAPIWPVWTLLCMSCVIVTEPQCAVHLHLCYQTSCCSSTHLPLS